MTPKDKNKYFFIFGNIVLLGVWIQVHLTFNPQVLKLAPVLSDSGEKKIKFKQTNSLLRKEFYGSFNDTL